MSKTVWALVVVMVFGLLAGVSPALAQEPTVEFSGLFYLPGTNHFYIMVFIPEETQGTLTGALKIGGVTHNFQERINAWYQDRVIITLVSHPLKRGQSYSAEVTLHWQGKTQQRIVNGFVPYNNATGR